MTAYVGTTVLSRGWIPACAWKDGRVGSRSIFMGTGGGGGFWSERRRLSCWWRRSADLAPNLGSEASLPSAAASSSSGSRRHSELFPEPPHGGGAEAAHAQEVYDAGWELRPETLVVAQPSGLDQLPGLVRDGLTDSRERPQIGAVPHHRGDGLRQLTQSGGGLPVGAAGEGRLPTELQQAGDVVEDLGYLCVVQR